MNIYRVRCKVIYGRAGDTTEIIDVATKGDAHAACVKLTRHIRANYSIETFKRGEPTDKRQRATRVDVENVFRVCSDVLV